MDVERFLSTGLADPSFGTNGIINLSRLGMINVGAITLDSSGRILVAGSGTVNDVTSLILTRLTTAGAVDTTFGSYGTAVLPLANHSVFASSIAVESDGSTLIGAQTETDGGFAMNWLLSHVTASGAVDTAFGTNGVAIFPQFTNWPPSSIEPLSGGSFLAGGMLNSTAGIARFTPTGTLDTTFGSDGVAAVGSGQLELFSAQVESDGTIVCGGGGTDDAFVSRLLASGATDTSFGTTFGVSSTSLPASVSESIDGDGSFAIGADGSGYVVNSSTAVPSFYVTKYLDVAPATVTSTPAPSGVGVVSGLVYNDAYASGTYATGDAGLSGRVVYADLNGDDQLDDDEPSTLTISSGAYTLANVPSGSAIIRAVAPATYFNTGSPAGVQTVTVTTGSATSGVNFGQYQNLTVSGTVYEDADGNGRRSFNDPTPSGVVIYDDVNNNGVLDAGEPFTTTSSDGSYSLPGIPPSTTSATLRLVAPAGYIGENSLSAGFGNFSGGHYNYDWPLTNQPLLAGAVEAPISGTSNMDFVAGQTVYADLNGNGKLDPGEPFTTTDNTGFFTMPFPGSAAVRLRVLLTGSEAVTSPSAGYITVYPNSAVVGRVLFTLGNVPTGGTISGTIYNDADGNNQYDAGDEPVDGRSVFLDLNGNGTYDTGEPIAETDASGYYQFTDLPVGSYTVVELLPRAALSYSSRTSPASRSTPTGVLQSDGR